MKLFLRRCLLFVLPVLAGLTGIAFLADGYTDPYYLRFTSPRQNALIIGSSRAAEGLHPAVLTNKLGSEYAQPMYNFCFSVNYSPFGPAYLDAIRKKLNDSIKNSLFIIAVDPWSLAVSKQASDDTAWFSEEQYMLGNNHWINTKPCFTYLAKDYPTPYISLLTGKIHREVFHFRPPFQLHEDGWLEVSRPMDSASLKANMQLTLKMYAGYRDNKKISHARLSYLAKTIAFLQERGDVYLVRLPVHGSVLAIENQLCPGFNAIIDSIARRHRLPYFSFIDSAAKYTYIDGSHLWKNSGALVSEELSRLILQHRHPR